MIVFTLTNTLSGQVYVGTTRDAPEQRWAQLCQAAADGIEADLYSDIRHCGEAAFELQEWAVAESLPELRQLTEEALQEYQAINLHGIRTRAERSGSQWLENSTSRPSDASTASATSPSTKTAAAPQPHAAVSQTSARPVLKAPTTPSPKATSTAGAGNKLPSGRASSSSKEKKVREGIEAERLARQSEERARQLAQADEMAAIMARIDQRSKR